MDKLVMEFFKDLKGRPNKKGEPITPQTHELFNCSNGGWKAIGYSLVATSPLNAGDAWGKRRLVVASQGAQAIAEFDAWFYAGIKDGLVPVWRYYVSYGRCTMRNDEFKNSIVYRRDTKDASVLVEFIPAVFTADGKFDMKLLVEVFADEMNVAGTAEQFMLMSLLVGRGSKVLWTSSGNEDAA